MDTRHQVRRRITLIAVVLLVLAVGQVSIGDEYVSARQDNIDSNQAARLTGVVDIQDPGTDELTAAVDCTDTGCPSAPSTLDKCVERTDFCVYYTTDSISETEAEWAADVVQDYWNRFVSLGFNEPKHSGKLSVHLTDTTDCNGETGWSSNAISTYAGCFDTTLLAQKVLGHELTHRVQYAHDSGTGAPIQTKFLKEGTARATEDNWFTEIDHWAAALSHSSFNREANNYLAATNNDITSYAMRYKSCLWWKYAMEQYGTTLTEPQRGIDFVRQVYDQNTAGYSSIAAVNQALSSIGAGTNFDQSFKQFAVANWTKDLTGVPDSSYYYDDEDEPGSPAVYGPLEPEDGGTIQTGTSATWNNWPVSRYALKYFAADIGSSCPLVSASFHRDDDGPAFYHLITQDGTTFKTHVQGSGADWTQAFLNDGLTSIVAVIGSLGNSSQVDIELACADPVLEIKMPNSVAVARVQPGTKFLVQVQVTDGSPTGPVVAGLTNSDFSVQVNRVDAPVTGGGFIQEQYWLLVQAPESLSDGTYDLEVFLEEPGTSTPIASDISLSSVIYTADLVDQVLVIDRSGSMGMGDPARLEAAQEAASFYVDVTRDADGLAVVPYHHDVQPDPFDMAIVDPYVRREAKDYIELLSDDGMTSIGDGLRGAVDQRASSPTGNPLCSFVLLSDGMENSEAFWIDVREQVIDSGCPVTAIAFGPESDEDLMQDIATDTGGIFFYNDVYVSTLSESVAAVPADMALDLGSTYEYAEGHSEGRQRLLAEKGSVSSSFPKAEHMVMVDETIGEAVFALDWYEIWLAELELILVDPQGKQYDSRDPGYTFEDYDNHHVGWRIPNPEPGEWLLVVEHLSSEEETVPYQVLVSGRTGITLELLLPDRLGTRYETGQTIPIYAILSSSSPIPGAIVEATITAPDGTETIVPLHDDGQHGDGAASDGLYAGVYTALNQAEPVKPTGEDDQSTPKDEGSYRIVARATHPKFQREALGSFTVLEGDDLNGNRIPDNWEKLHGLDDADGDPDMDNLLNNQEYQNGTDPNDPDTDDGGEKDGSEVNNGRDPLDPADDGIKAPDFLQVTPLDSAVLLHYDFKPAYSLMHLYRAEYPYGPWQEVKLDPGLPQTGSYTDTVPVNDQSYIYRTEAVLSPMEAGEAAPDAPSAGEITSAVVTSEPVTPSEDPLLPEAHVDINMGASSTKTRLVTLTFTAYESEGTDANESFEDIVEMRISSKPSDSSAKWQDFEQGVSWMLDSVPGQVAKVYVLFRDKAGNVSVGEEVGAILYNPDMLYLPLALRALD